MTDTTHEHRYAEPPAVGPLRMLEHEHQWVKARKDGSDVVYEVCAIRGCGQRNPEACQHRWVTEVDCYAAGPDGVWKPHDQGLAGYVPTLAVFCADCGVKAAEGQQEEATNG